MYSASNGNNGAVIRALKKSFADLPFGRTAQTPEENTAEGYAVPESYSSSLCQYLALQTGAGIAMASLTFPSEEPRRHQTNTAEGHAVPERKSSIEHAPASRQVRRLQTSTQKNSPSKILNFKRSVSP